MRAVLCAFFGLLTAAPVSAATWGESYIPNVPLVTQDGQTVRLYDDLIKNKIVLINFMYASCKEVCPLATARMAQAQKEGSDVEERSSLTLAVSTSAECDAGEKGSDRGRALSEISRRLDAQSRIIGNGRGRSSGLSGREDDKVGGSGLAIPEK